MNENEGLKVMFSVILITERTLKLREHQSAALSDAGKAFLSCDYDKQFDLTSNFMPQIVAFLAPENMFSFQNIQLCVNICQQD